MEDPELVDHGRGSDKQITMAKITVKKNPEKPEKTEILAEAIIRIGEGFEKLKSSGLNQKAIVVLLQDQTKLGKYDIVAVLDGEIKGQML